MDNESSFKMMYVVLLYSSGFSISHDYVWLRFKVSKTYTMKNQKKGMKCPLKLLYTIFSSISGDYSS